MHRISKGPANSNTYPLDLRIQSILSSDAIFQINSTKLYALVITLLINNNIKFFENIKQGFKWAIVNKCLK